MKHFEWNPIAGKILAKFHKDHAEKHRDRKLKGKKFDGVVCVQGVDFHLKGVVEKYYSRTQRCLVTTQVNKRIKIPADAVRGILV